CPYACSHNALVRFCWLPYHVYFLFTYYNADVIHAHFIQHLYLAIYWLAMSNSCYNPIVYYVMNSRFRSYFQAVMCMNHKSSQTTGENGIPLQAKASLKHPTRLVPTD
ncbi:hypothetical protein JTE90_027051, partial [Oedothorax gibbosus]